MSFEAIKKRWKAVPSDAKRVGDIQIALGGDVVVNVLHNGDTATHTAVITAFTSAGKDVAELVGMVEGLENEVRELKKREPKQGKKASA